MKRLNGVEEHGLRGMWVDLDGLLPVRNDLTHAVVNRPWNQEISTAEEGVTSPFAQN